MWTLTENWANQLKGSLDSQQVTTEERKVEIDQNSSIQIEGRVRVGEVTTSVTPVAGDIRFNSSTNKHQGFNGTVWQDFY